MSTAAARKAELTELLSKVRTAIGTIVTGGQAYSAENRAMTRADLRQLRELEKDYQRELAQLERGRGMRVFGVVHR